MTIFSSIDPATVPYRAGQKVNVYADAAVIDGQEYTIVARDWKPTHPFNPILAEYRRSILEELAFTTPTEWLYSLNNPLPGAWAYTTSEQITHATRVLTKLAALTGEEC